MNMRLEYWSGRRFTYFQESNNMTSPPPSLREVVRQCAEALEAVHVQWVLGEPLSTIVCEAHDAAMAALQSTPDPAQEMQERIMTDAQIKHMVDRFLSWRLLDNFNPDAGISFKTDFNEHTDYPIKHRPVGTNSFDVGQAEAMVRYIVDGMPPPKLPGDVGHGGGGIG